MRSRSFLWSSALIGMLSESWEILTSEGDFVRERGSNPLYLQASGRNISLLMRAMCLNCLMSEFVTHPRQAATVALTCHARS